MTWAAIVAVGVGSFAFRLGPLLALQRMTLFERGDRMIRYSGLAAITALIVVSTKHSATGSAALPTVVAVAAAVVLAARNASMTSLLVRGGAIYACSLVVVEMIGW